MYNAIGIDLGTTNSVAAYSNKGKIEIININGKNILPSVICIKGNDILVGSEAKSRRLISPENTILSSKRYIGKEKTYNIKGRIFKPEDVAYHILKTIKEKASESIGEKIKDVVITVPAYFTSEQREETKRAGERAGLNILRLIPEPTAAALDYGINQSKDQIIMVYDLGGGTFDISIMKVSGNDFEVLAVDGDSNLGGIDFDEIIYKMILSKVNEELRENIVLSKDKKYVSVVTKIKEEAEKVKINLSEFEEVEIMIPNLIEDYSLDMSISRKEFNIASAHLIDKTVSKIHNALKIARLDEDDIDRIILVGGSTKMPIIKETIKYKFKEPYIASNVDEVVARGAALMASSLSAPEVYRGGEINKIDLTKNIIVKEKTVFTYGIDMIDKHKKLYFQPIIQRGSTLPAVNGVFGYTMNPYQEQVYMSVLRGESRIPDENEYLGELKLDIKNISKEQVPIFALFEIDEDMIINFTSVEIPLTREFHNIIKNNNVNEIHNCIKKGILNGKTIRLNDKNKN